MRLIPSDPDVATIHRRITEGELDLQPNFQRGEVWTSSKKQKLIDSILREWHVPPIHVIQGGGGADEVLDGQQRLASIRDFIDGKLKVNGNIEPYDETIFQLDGLTFTQLPGEWKRKVLRFPLRLFSIVDYSPSEPSELFYRLNQPASLTAAEQRNSFFGIPREQIKDLVFKMGNLGIDKGFLGFSNSRMAYDDVLARVCVALENGLDAKVSANLLADRYRSGVPFEPSAYSRVEKSITILAKIKNEIDTTVKLNKASLLSWLLFICRIANDFSEIKIQKYSNFLEIFENERMLYQLGFTSSRAPTEYALLKQNLNEIYTDRVTARVADASSVVLRDLTLWGLFIIFYEFKEFHTNSSIEKYRKFLLQKNEITNRVSERELLEFPSLNNSEWSNL
jgi:hypothetical protein